MRTIVLVLAVGLILGCERRETTVAEPAAGPQRTVTVVQPQDAKTLGEKEIAVPVSPKDLFLERVKLGTAKGADGTVSDDRREFTAGEPVAITAWFKESPAGLQSSAKWYGAGDTVLHEERREMKGAKVATFAAPSGLKKGTYRVVAFWGGNEAADITFKVK